MYSPSNQFGKFLLTPQIHEYESFRGFITRTAVRNDSLQLVRPLLKSLAEASQFIPSLAQLSNTDPDILKSHGALVVHGRANRMMARFGDTHISSNHLRHTTRHVCPQCLAENGISMGYWDLRLYSVCHRHGVKMVNECSNCKLDFEWHIGSPDTCKCGMPLSQINANPCPSADGIGLGRVLAMAYMHSLNHTSFSPIQNHGNGDRFVPLDWAILLIEFIGHVLVPNFLRHIGEEDYVILPHTFRHLISTMLLDSRYRGILRQAVFLHAAKDPLTMRLALSPGNTPADIARNFDGCTDDIPFHQCLWEFQRKIPVVRPALAMKPRKQLIHRLGPRSTRRKVPRSVGFDFFTIEPLLTESIGAA